MFAVIKTGGKQYKVAEGDVISIEKITGEHKEGDKIAFDQVLLKDDGNNTSVGTPLIAGAKVEGEIAEIDREKKKLVFRYKPKSRWRKKNTHRQPYFKIKITKIS